MSKPSTAAANTLLYGLTIQEGGLKAGPNQHGGLFRRNWVGAIVDAKKKNAELPELGRGFLSALGIIASVVNSRKKEYPDNDQVEHKMSRLSETDQMVRDGVAALGRHLQTSIDLLVLIEMQQIRFDANEWEFDAATVAVLNNLLTVYESTDHAIWEIKGELADMIGELTVECLHDIPSGIVLGEG